MHTVTKIFVASSTPLLLAGNLTAADSPATQPATRPAIIIAQSNIPLVIPDGTSPQHPGPDFVDINQQRMMLRRQQEQFENQGAVFGLRG